MLSQSYTIATANYCLSIDNDYLVISTSEGECLTTFRSDLIRALAPVVLKLRTCDDAIAATVYRDVCRAVLRAKPVSQYNADYSVSGVMVPSASIPTPRSSNVTFSKPNPERHLYKSPVAQGVWR